MDNIETGPLSEIVAGILASKDRELGLSAEEAQMIRERIETEHEATSFDPEDAELIAALSAHDLLGDRILHGRAW